MRNTNIFDLIHKVVLVILLMGTLPLALPAAENLIYNLKFKQLSAPYALPTNEVQKVYQTKTDLCGLPPVMACAATTVMRPGSINQTFTLRNC